MIKSRRVADQIVRLGNHYDRNLNQSTYPFSSMYFMSERVDSGNHPGWFYDQDGGGYFNHQLEEYRLHASPSVRVSATAGGSNPFLSYTGLFACSIPPGASLIGDGSSWGATAYARMKPTKFDYSLFNMVYELKDLPSMFQSLKNFWSLNLFKSPRSFVREGSNRFLGQVFGWNPLVDDVFKLIEKQQKIQKRIDWLVRNQGKWIKRKVTLVDSQSLSTGEWVNDYGALNPILTTQHYITIPSYRDTIWTGNKIWATADFKYFLPEVPTGVKLKDVVRRSLQGLHSPRIDELYRAIPWTWLIDWSLNMAQVLQNCDPGVADRVAARRFYIMRQQEVVRIRHAQAVMRGYGGGPNVPVRASAWRRNLLQTRTLGLPFYPGNPNNLSGMQYAILGALGASRL